MCHPRADYPLGAIFKSQVVRIVAPRRHALERVVVLAPAIELGIGEAGVPQIPARRGGIQLHEPRRLLERKRAEVKGVIDAEDNDVAGDTQRQRHSGDRREAGIFAQHSQSEAKVFQQCFTKARAAHVAAYLANALHVTESLACFACRGLR